jgi:OmcA/MtrC family decaheme c-type cytochrome
VTVAEGQAPVVTFRATDASGQPFDLIGEMSATPRRISPSFVLSRLGANGKYTSYLTRTATGTPFGPAATAPALPTATQAAAESSAPARMTGGENGVYTYTFAAPVTGVDAAATHRLALYGTRTFADRTYPSATTFDFNPSGGAVNDREIVVDDACNKCHTVVNAHGGARRGVKLCLTCHSPQTVDPETGNNVDMALMIHKIHKGRLLENGYTIIGNRGSVHDYSHVAMGPSHSTYFEATLPPGADETTTITPPSDRGIIRECSLCHQGDQAVAINTNLSATTCTTCHDDVNPGLTPIVQNGGVSVPPGRNHGTPSVGSFPDTACTLCHGEGTGLSVANVHSVNYDTTRNLAFAPHVYTLKIDAVNGLVQGGEAPSVDFTLTLDGAPFNYRTAPANIGALAFQVAGPITDYAETLPAAFGTQSAVSAANVGRLTDIDAAAGKFRYTFAPGAVVPAGRSGVYVVSFESYYRESQLGSDGVQVSKPFAADPIFRGPNKNVFYVNVATGAPATQERRLIVSNDKCNNCHVDLGFHSNRSREGIDYCATCHNPNLSNAARARFQLSETATPAALTAAGRSGLTGLADQTTPVFIAESVSANVFIHKIHMGAELSVPYRLGANRSAGDRTPGEGLADFSQFEAPSPMGNCQTCHEGETYRMPSGLPLLPVTQAILGCPVQDAEGWCSGPLSTTGAFTNTPVLATLVTPPQKAVCTSCHDDAAASAHADLNTIRPMTATAVETCDTCHGAGKDFDAILMHPPVLAPTAQVEETP